MIYLRPSRRIKSAEPSDRIVISDSLLDEYLDRLNILNPDKRAFSLHLEASNGVALSEQGVTATKLSARILTREGVDVTTLVKTLSLAWQIEGKEVGQGLAYTAQAASLKSWHTKVTATTTVARIFEAMGKLDKHAPGVQRVLEEYTIEASIELRRDSILLQRIPTTDLLIDSLKQDRQFLASVKGDKGDSVTLADLSIRWEDDKLTIGGAKSRSLKGQDAPPVRPNLIKKGESLYPNMGQSADNVSVTYKDGVYRITKHAKMWRTITMYTRPLLPQKSTKTRIVSWRVVGASRPELLNEHQIKSKGGRYYTVGNTNHEEQWVRGGVYANPFSGEENNWIDGDWVEFADIKVELVEDGEPLEPTTYLPHIDDLKGDSVTALQVVAELNKTDIFKLSVRDALKLDTDFVARTKGEKGDSVTLADLDIRWDDDKLLIGGAKSESLKGQDAPPIRPNLLRGFMGAEKTTTSAVGSANVHARLGIKPFLEVGKKYVLSADFELLEGSANAVSLGLVTTAGGFIRETKTALNGTKTRASLYINIDDTINLDSIVDVVGYAGEHGKARGNLARYYNIKLEEVTSDSDKASAYLPHPDDLKGAAGKSPTPQEVAGVINTPAWQALLADQTARKVTDSDTHLAKIREGMVTQKELKGYGQELNAVIKRQTDILGMHETLAQWVDVHKMAINSINRDMEQATTNIYNHTIKLKKHDDTLITLVEQDIIKFSYHAATSQEWADYTDREYVGGGHHPDPWGGVGDGYMRTVHNYEIWRSLDRIPSVYIEQSRKTLRTDEYQINGQPHRDLSALIVYSLQDVAPIERNTARHWQLFTSPFVPTVLRYGNKTVMGTESVSGNKVGDYYNLPLDKSCTYDIYCNNDGSGKYKIYIIKNGEYK